MMFVRVCFQNQSENVTCFNTEIRYIWTWSWPCKLIESMSVKGLLCKRCDWKPPVAFSARREVNVWNEEWETCCAEQEAVWTSWGTWWHLKCHKSLGSSAQACSQVPVAPKPWTPLLDGLWHPAVFKDLSWCLALPWTFFTLPSLMHFLELRDGFPTFQFHMAVCVVCLLCK